LGVTEPSCGVTLCRLSAGMFVFRRAVKADLGSPGTPSVRCTVPTGRSFILPAIKDPRIQMRFKETFRAPFMRPTRVLFKHIERTEPTSSPFLQLQFCASKGTMIGSLLSNHQEDHEENLGNAAV
jgi:hypothetical protein